MVDYFRDLTAIWIGKISIVMFGWTAAHRYGCHALHTFLSLHHKSGSLGRSLYASPRARLWGGITKGGGVTSHHMPLPPDHDSLAGQAHETRREYGSMTLSLRQ